MFRKGFITGLLIICIFSVFPAQAGEHSEELKKIEAKIKKLNKMENSSPKQKAEFNIRYSAYTIGETVIIANQKKSNDGKFNALSLSSLIDQGDEYNMSSEENCLYDEKGLICYTGTVTEQGVEVKIHLTRKDKDLQVYITTGDTTEVQKFPLDSFDITSADFCNRSSMEKFSSNSNIRILDLNSISIRKGAMKIGKGRVRYNRKTYQCRTYIITYDNTRTKVFFEKKSPINTPLKIEESDKDGKINSKLTALKINDKIV